MSPHFFLQSFDVIDSTSMKARELVMGGVAPWTVVVASEQNQGYGRKGNFWYSPIGGLYFSIILPRGDINDLQALTIFAATTVSETLKEQFRIKPSIKLPNDVYLNDKKICGILTENVVGERVLFSVMGIGLNTNIEQFPHELENGVTSLKIELGRTIDNEALLEHIVTRLQDDFRTMNG